jgi:hypothetical protein
MRDLGDHCARARPDGAIAVRLLPSFRESVMESRTTSKLVTFRKPFTLSGLEGIQPPGTYTVLMEEEMLDTLSLVGWRQTGCVIILHRDGGEEHAAIDPQELREALVQDGGQGTDPPASPSVAMGRGRRVRDQLRRGGRQ